jgi:putative oxidoreductase
MSDQPTSLFPSAEQKPGRRQLEWNPSTDVGLVLLRLAMGGVFFAHGVQKVFGLWGGPGIGGYARNLEGFGYTSAATLSWVVGIAELVFGAFLVLGVLTPFAAAGLVGIKINAVLLKAGAGFFIASPAGANAVELDVVLGLGAAALVFTGPGRIALDRGPWHTRPAWGVLCIVLGVAAGLLVYFLLRR